VSREKGGMISMTALLTTYMAPQSDVASSPERMPSVVLFIAVIIPFTKTDGEEFSPSVRFYFGAFFV
jgi:hypothetical protein